MTARNRFATSLVLSGAGAYSAYEVGVMSALFAGECSSTGYTPFDPDLIVGSSAGAMNAAALITYEARTGSLMGAIAEMETIWLERIAEAANACGNGVYRIRGLPFALFDRECLRRGITPIVSDAAEDLSLFLRGSLRSAAEFLQLHERPLEAIAEHVNISSLISIAPYLESMQEILSPDDIARSDRQLRIVAMDLSAGKTRLFDQNDFARLGYQPILAATALPVFFPSIVIEGHDYINGVTLASTPLPTAIDESDTIHLVYMDPTLANISPVRLEDFIDAVDRIMVVNFAYMLNREIRQAHFINTALELIAAGVPGDRLSRLDVLALLRSLASIQDRIRAGDPHRPLTIHRYHPRDDLGGDLGLMNLGRERIADVIERGYTDTLAHDCEASGCVIPGRPLAPRQAQATAVAAGPVGPLDGSNFQR